MGGMEGGPDVDLEKMLSEFERNTISESSADETVIKEMVQALEKQITAEIHRSEINPPKDMKVKQKLLDATVDVTKIDVELRTSRKLVDEAHKKSNEIKLRRKDMFMKNVDKVKVAVKEIYKDFTRVMSLDSANAPKDAIEMVGEASLDVKSPGSMTAYDEWVMYTVRPNFKRWREMSELSGGEKTMAAM